MFHIQFLLRRRKRLLLCPDCWFLCVKIFYCLTSFQRIVFAISSFFHSHPEIRSTGLATSPLLNSAMSQKVVRGVFTLPKSNCVERRLFDSLTSSSSSVNSRSYATKGGWTSPEVAASAFAANKNVMLPDNSFKGKVAFITGGGTGLGNQVRKELIISRLNDASTVM